jgi:hypothetical protein
LVMEAPTLTHGRDINNTEYISYVKFYNQFFI